jgi:AraC family transcriptional regulator
MKVAGYRNSLPGKVLREVHLATLSLQLRRDPPGESVHPAGLATHLLCIHHESSDGKVTLEAANESSEQPIIAGRSLLIPARTPFAWGWSSALSTTCVLVPTDQVANALADHPLANREEVTLRAYHDLHDERLVWLTRELRGEVGSTAPGSRRLVDALASALIAQLASRHAVLAVARVHDFLMARLGQGLSLSAIAAIAELSPYHFARRFRAATGMSPWQYLVQLRLERGRELVLNRHDLTIAQIAETLGFADAAHFGRAFAARFGSAPGQMRRK